MYKKLYALACQLARESKHRFPFNPLDYNLEFEYLCTKNNIPDEIYWAVVRTYDGHLIKELVIA